MIRKTTKGYPIGLVFAGVPITYYVTTLIAFVTYYFFKQNVFWYRLGYFCNFAGIISGAALAVPDFLRWAFGHRLKEESEGRGLIYGSFYAGALFLFAFNGFQLLGTWDDIPQNIIGLLVSTTIGVALTVIEGGRGWQWPRIFKGTEHFTAKRTSG